MANIISMPNGVNEIPVHARCFCYTAISLMKGLQDQNSQIKKAGIYSFFALAFFVGALLLYQKLVGGSATYISSPNRGFYPENLLKTYPAFPASFIKSDTLSTISLTGDKIISTVFLVVYIFFLVTLTALMGRQLVRQGFKRLNTTQSFFYISYFLSFAIIILLTVLSLRVEQEQIFAWYLWTYVEDSRYYGLLNVLMHLGVFILYQYAFSNYKKILKYFCIALLILMIPEMVRGLYFDINRIRKFGKEEYSWQYENRFQQYAHSIIKKERSQNASARIVVTGTSYNMNNRVTINSHVSPLSDVSKINNFPLLNTKSSVVLLAMLQKDSLVSYQPFITRKEVQFTEVLMDLIFTLFMSTPINTKNIFVIIPAYNENTIIESVIKELLPYNYSIVVVDDGSTKSLTPLLNQLPVYFIRHKINLGQGAALQTGIDFALSKKADYIVTFDADGQHQASDIEKLIQALIHYKSDIVSGSRFLKGATQHMSFLRKQLLQIARYVNFIFTGLLLTDAHNGLRAMTREAAQKIQLQENGMAHATEILHQIKKEKLKHKEVPVDIHYTDYSKKKGQTLFSGFRIFLTYF